MGYKIEPKNTCDEINDLITFYPGIGFGVVVKVLFYAE